MCDTMVALGNVTADGAVWFAKNSDREPNEAHALVWTPAAHQLLGAQLRCTHLTAPQARETHAALLSKPFWMWGCEMGVNEHGVAIGNEAVFTKEPYRDEGLLGMDMLRLALERATTAPAALDVIIELLETYGQYANGGYQHRTRYHNAFLIADSGEAWVLETAGRYWAALQVRDVYTISNGLTIGSVWDRASDGLVRHAIEKGWCRSEADFDFARCYSDPFYSRAAQCAVRRRRSLVLLEAQLGALTAESFFALLRDHGTRAVDAPQWRPAQSSMGSLCMHAGFGPLRPSQSTGSLVAHLEPQLTSAWVTGTSAPCTGIFKPVWPEAGLPEGGFEPGAAFDAAMLWWRHEELHRALLAEYPGRLASYRAERDTLEQALLAETLTLAERVRGQPPEGRREALAACSASAFAQADVATTRWLELARAVPATRRLPLLYGLGWRGFNRAVGMP